MNLTRPLTRDLTQPFAQPGSVPPGLGSFLQDESGAPILTETDQLIQTEA